MFRVIFCIYKQPCEVLFSSKSLQDCLDYIESRHVLFCGNPNKSLRLRKD